MTLVELLIAMTITSMTSVVLGGLIMAVQTARQHTEGLEEATLQAQASFDRIRFMVSHAGVYQLDGEPTCLGLAVVNHRWSSFDLPDVLVVWSGGRNGGMAEAGLQRRLPGVNELVLYTPDSNDPSRLVEIVVPGNAAAVDFRDPGFANVILSLLRSANAEPVLLCDRIRVSHFSESHDSLASDVGNVRFEVEQTPSDSDLASIAPGTFEWIDLPWAQGIVSSESGLRQASVRMEFQIEPRSHESAGTDFKPIAIPFFASVSYRYAYQP